MDANNIRLTLQLLADEVKSTSPGLSDKLGQFIIWIKNKSNGKITQKKYVAIVLKQLINDIKIWQMFNNFSQNDKQIFLSHLTPSEKYWYFEIFPSWFTKKDKHLPCWKQNLMSGLYEDKDSDIRILIDNKIKELNGNSLHRFLLDLSMATDIIVNHSNSKPLCVQYTNLSNDYTQTKIEKWRDIVFYWGIKRAFFIHLNPKYDPDYTLFVRLVFHRCYSLREHCYNNIAIKRIDTPKL
jgi:hypothetical protein